MDDITFETVSAPDGHLVDVVFIHGLKGSPTDTWTSKGCADPSGPRWIEWLSEDIEVIATYTLGYPTSVLFSPTKQDMTLYERAQNALERMATHGLGARPIVFVTHSLGGLLAKQLIRTGRESLESSWKAIGNNVIMVVFIATPHQGSSIANIVTLIASKLSSQYSVLLEKGNNYLNEINQYFRIACESDGIKTLVYYETIPIAGKIIVALDSADPGVGTFPPIPIDADHLGICKPKSRDSLLYSSIKARLTKLVGELAAGQSELVSSNEELIMESAADRRSLQEKLIDAHREHEYPAANDMQSKFAQRYHKFGLHDPARRKHELLLAELQARFLNHVYHPKVCGDASVEEVQDALQTKVIDPVVQLFPNDNEVNSRTALQALYFLTERCHIRWDQE